MNILFEHQHPLPVKKYGGTERILFWLMKELVRQGHGVFLIGHPDSRVEGTGIQLIPRKEGDFRQQIPSGIDLVHLFYTPPQPLDHPTLVTIEGNGRAGETFPLNTVFVSRNHALRHGSEHFVYNGLDFHEYPFRPQHRGKWTAPKDPWKHFLFLAKGSWKVKNLSACVKACKKEKRHLHIAGGRVFGLSPYIHSYGMVGQEKKMELLQKTEALLFPVRWHEPFGIAMIEAFSQGLPVIGTPYGSLPEIISPESGVLVENFASLREALQRPPSVFFPEQIRDYVEKKFSLTQMAQKYLALYEKIRRGEVLNPTPPTLLAPGHPEDLLPF